MVTVHEADIVKRVTRKLLPLLVVLYTVAYVDRSAVGFAQLHMGADRGIGDAAFGLGAGLFFIAYFLFEVPSNVLMQRFGPRMWFVRILVTWGAITMLMALTQGPGTFYVLRFLLGVAEAGFYPGVIFYLTTWFPHRHRTKATGIFVISAPLAFLLMSPLAGWLLEVEGLGMVGWQWLFLVVGATAVLMALPTWRYLPEGPRSVKWLSRAEADWIEGELARDKVERGQEDGKNPLRTLVDKRVLTFALLFFPSTVGVYGLSFWLPQVVDRFSGSTLNTGLLTDVPYVFALVGVLVTSRWAAKRFRDNWVPLAVLFVGAGVGMGASAFFTTPALQLAALSLAAFCVYSIAGVFWALPSGVLAGATAAVAIAAINSFGNLGGFIGPYVVGVFTQASGSTAAGMYFLMAVLWLGALGTVIARRAIARLQRSVVASRDDADEVVVTVGTSAA
ncbi:MFS transporter [Xylanimonas ulmi]|uniref:Sugar phosphate permease n=1 Tax=Xylanimonas ulmi TaxID=228973 RepID=A0A4Q7M5Q6_9MICO|nr:MFS transporter [Xylanibacterium ulmi]RZS62984.1 sugar phosphate permease [Xylanibacterium ulmi]